MYGVLGVECSNHSVPTIYSQEIQELSDSWIFLWARVLSRPRFCPHFLPHPDFRSSNGTLMRFIAGCEVNLVLGTKLVAQCQPSR